jgi:uncharacterized phage protein gp47/JayE
MSGITPQGFVTKRLPEVKTDIENRLRDSLGDIDLREESIFGQQVGIYSELYALLWSLAEDTYNSQYPDTAQGRQLDHVASINGLLRIAATPTQATCICRGTPSTVISAGREVSSRSTGDVYRAIQTVSLNPSNAVFVAVRVSVVEEAAYTVSIGSLDYTYTAQPGDGEEEILLGLFTALNAAPVDHQIIDDCVCISVPSPAAFALTANLVFNEVGSLVQFRNKETGARLLPANDLTEIETPIAGWNSVNNPEPGLTGRNRETDQQLRLRREQSVRIAATNTLDAITGRLRQLEDVTDVNVLQNNTDDTDEFGTLRQHIWAIVEGDTDESIANVIYRTLSAGIGMRGAVTFNVVSPITGKEQEIKFDRPTYIEPDIEIEYVPLPDFPVDGEQRIKDALVARTFRLGEPLIYSRLYTPINSVPGVQVDKLEVDEDTANILADPNEKIRILEGNITLVDVS